MNILNKLTKKNLKLNVKRTIVTVIGVALSTALICAVAGMITSFQKTLVDMTIQEEGNYHVCFQNVEQNQLKYIENNSNVKSYFLTSNIGWAKLEGSKNDYKPYVSIMEFDKDALENGGLKLVEGRMPKNSNEIVIPSHIESNGQVKLNIGDTITFDVGTRQSLDGTVLTKSNELITEDDPSNDDNVIVQEKIVNTASKTYTIVGIIERPGYRLEDYNSPGYTIISYLENANEKSNISVLYKKAKSYSENTKEILKTLKENTGNDYETIKNSDLLRFQGAVSENTMSALYSIGAIVIGIIVVSSVFVIRNSFNISVAEKNRQYGMLSSIGATSKQIKKSVLFEGFIIGLIAIPLGILCGIIAIVILIFIVNYLLGDMLNGVKFVYGVPVLPILLSVVISAVTIYLSCLLPARRASKISPIDAIRGKDDIKIKAKKVKTSKLTKKLFGIGGTIASKNLKRSRKKYRTTVISIVVSIVIFISLSSFIGYGKKLTGVYYKEMDYNIVVYLADDGEMTRQVKEIVNLGNIKEYSYGCADSAKIDLEKYGTDFGKQIYKAMVGNEEIDGDINNQNIRLIGINDDYYKKYLEKIGVSEDYKTATILVDDSMVTTTDEKKEVQNYYNIKDGETITIKEEIVENDVKTGEKEYQIKIAKRTDIRPMGFEYSYGTSGTIFMAESYLKSFANPTNYPLFINANNADELENQIKELAKTDENFGNYDITNYETYVKQENRMVLLIAIFLYGFIGVITLIGVTNIFNTISTNMILRSKEFAMLKSIGMTTKEFNKMIRLESILYGLKSLLIGIPIGIGGSYLVYKSFAQSMDFGFMIPWTSIIISIIFVFIIVGLTMKYSLNKINKQNIIETIRKDNI